MTGEERAQYIIEKLMENPEFRKVFVGALTDAANEVTKVIKALQQDLCEMTAEEYRQRMIQAFHNADCDELIALVVLPTEKEFEHLGWLLEKHYKAKPEPCEDVPDTNIGKSEIPTGWIPVSERYPTGAHKRYLVCYEDGCITIEYLYFDGDGNPFFSEMELGVVAWMPLPEPYKQEVEE